MEYLSESIAFLALLLSGCATYRSLKFKKSEKELVEVQKKLNQLMLKKEEREATQAKKADLGANFISIGKQKRRLKIFNKGESTAYNVNIEFPEGNDLVLRAGIDEKFPLEIMERGQSVDLIASMTMQSKRKIKVKLTWEDESDNIREKILFPTL